MAQRKSMIRRLRRRLRRRIDQWADNPVLLRGLSRLFASRIRRWHDRTAWQIHGQEALAAELRSGRPVILAVWHGRLAMTPYMWPQAWGPVCSLTSQALPGRLVAETLRRFGWANAAMHDSRSNRATSMQVARMLRDGTSIGIACDGPLGPVHEMKTVPIDWARLSGAPIWLWTYSTDRYRQLGSWDRMILPGAGGQGVMLYRKWEHIVPRKLDPAALEQLRARLESDLIALTREADRAVGHPDLLG